MQQSWVDGFLLGDGYFEAYHPTQKARAKCSVEHEDFCRYLMSGFDRIGVSPPQFAPPNEQQRIKGGKGVYYSQSHFDPLLYPHWQRWYGTGMKAVPEDVIVNAESLRLWYLGDGSLTTHKKDCMELRLSTESFTPEDIDGILLPKLYALGVKAKRNGDGRILVRACSYPRFFELIGSMSPISCYDYKYRLPQWRFSAKRMSQVAQELSIDYQQLAYWVKIGKVPCYRASEKGKPRFLPEHIAALEDFCEKLQLSEREYA